MSTALSAEEITPENMSSNRVSDDILMTHLVYKCLVKIGIWLWNKLEKFTGEELSLNFNWVPPFISKSVSYDC
jgi:hypothetical protein